MMRFVLVLVMMLGLHVKTAAAQVQQDVVWLQIEAQPSLDGALDRAAIYAETLPDVRGFALAGGWYAITIGPYSAQDAQEVLRAYRAQGLIPPDSYIPRSSTFGDPFWPVAQDGSVTAQALATAPVAANTPIIEQDASPPTVVENADVDPETPAQARRSESLLSRIEKQDLQIALQWAGFYNAAIDGAFGRGTRRSMAAWQTANGLEPTGILTTRQRAQLLGQYNAILDGLDMQLVRDLEAGIEVRLPTAKVSFDRYEPPFAQYNASADMQVRVLLISQTGDRDTLAGLYDILQTLTIVPLEGPRSLSRNSFTLVGRNNEFVSETEVRLEDGALKGFMLIWPAGDEPRRTRVLDEMRKSFVRRTGTIDPARGIAANQQVDLIAGLEVRTPLLSRSGFFVDDAGTVITTADAVENCTRITLDDLYDASLSGVDTTNGVAVLKPSEALSPPQVARFSPLPPRLQSEVAVAGYSFEGQLGAASLTFGKLADLKGLAGEAELNRLALAARPGDAGGPVFDANGNVFGMLLPRQIEGRQLPAEVSFALSSSAISGVLAQAGLSAQEGVLTASLAPEDITNRGVGMTVLVSCWE
ncbi:MAG: serine protease [Roseobacter sp.]